MIVIAALALAASTLPSTRQQIERLRCGSADLRMTSEVSTDPKAPLAPIDQTLTRREGIKRFRIPLEHSTPVVVDGHHVPDRYVTSWACVAGNGETHYVLVGYACTLDPGLPHDCRGEKEWFRLLDERGRFADAGIPHGGAVRDRLNSRLGISQALATGVTMTPLLE